MSRWFTNSRFPEVDRKAWELSSPGAKVSIGPPRASRHHTVGDLAKMKMVGLYEDRAGEPPLPDPAHPRNAGERSAFAGLLIEEPST